MPRPTSPGRSLLKLLEQAAAPIYALDSRRRIVFANTALGIWLGREIASLIGLRCDYHAGSSEQASSEIGAALCPPPEAFLGQVAEGMVARTPSEQQPHELRPAQFTWLGGGSAGTGVLLVVVLPAEAPPGKPSTNVSITAADLHVLLQRVRGKLGRRYATSQLIGETDSIRNVREQVRVAIAARSRVLVVGRTGSGREHVARTIHYGHGAAERGPLVPIACSLVDAEAMQSTLTSLLREQMDLPPEHSPVALLVDVDRLRPDAQQELAGFMLLPNVELQTLATARVPLQRLAAKGKFRTDLAFALGTLTIRLPALKDRRDDVPLLAQHFLEEQNAAGGKQLSGFSSAAMEFLLLYDWPGNLDELAAAVHESCGRAAGPQVQPADIPDWVHLAVHSAAHPPRDLETIQLDEFLAEIEKELLQRALRVARGNKSKAAQRLGISRQRLLRRLSQLGLAPAITASDEEPVVFEPLPEES